MSPITSTSSDHMLLDVRGLKKHFPIQAGFWRRTVGYVRAVDGIDFQVRKGETFSLVGESGCGKTTTAHCILRRYRPTEGQILFQQSDGSVADIASLPERDLRPLRSHIQMVFQDPFSSLNPRMTLLDVIGEPLWVNGIRNRREIQQRVGSLLRMVGLRPEFMTRYPHAFSGGQRQRIGIARALALNPSLIVADEPVSALDVSVQAQILNLLLDLQQRLGLSLIFVAHNLGVVRHISDRVAVMYVGRIVEIAEAEALFSAPRHPYTEALLAAVPKHDPLLRSRRVPLEGDVADPSNPPSGCYFHPRCRYAEKICREEPPALREIEPGHFVCCHSCQELELAGVR